MPETLALILHFPCFWCVKSQQFTQSFALLAAGNKLCSAIRFKQGAIIFKQGAIRFKQGTASHRLWVVWSCHHNTNGCYRKRSQVGMHEEKHYFLLLISNNFFPESQLRSIKHTFGILGQECSDESSSEAHAIQLGMSAVYNQVRIAINVHVDDKIISSEGTLCMQAALANVPRLTSL